MADPAVAFTRLGPTDALEPSKGEARQGAAQAQAQARTPTDVSLGIAPDGTAPVRRVVAELSVLHRRLGRLLASNTAWRYQTFRAARNRHLDVRAVGPTAAPIVRKLHIYMARCRRLQVQIVNIEAMRENLSSSQLMREVVLVSATAAAELRKIHGDGALLRVLEESMDTFDEVARAQTDIHAAFEHANDAALGISEEELAELDAELDRMAATGVGAEAEAEAETDADAAAGMPPPVVTEAAKGGAEEGRRSAVRV